MREIREAFLEEVLLEQISEEEGEVEGGREQKSIPENMDSMCKDLVTE